MATFTINDYNVGQNLVGVTLQDNFGNVLDIEQLGHLMEFDASVVGQDLRITPITNGGRAIFKWLPYGYEGRITLTRYQGAYNTLISQINEQWFTQGLMTQFAITCTVLNPDGSSDEYQFGNCVLKAATLGNWRGDKEVDLTLQFSGQSFILTTAAATAVTLGQFALAAAGL